MRTGSERLQPLPFFGSNPGELNAWYYTPDEGADAGLALVVVLHGCTQDGRGFDAGSGWSQLAQKYGFAVLFPEQVRANNPNLCFNWFNPADTTRGSGEALSIAQMVEQMIEGKEVDPRRVFITGLSAGGAMTSVMLAVYPDLFAGGAILAGLPHGAASSFPEALQQMRAPVPSSRSSGRAITNARAHHERWPTVAVWHGTADAVVSPSNADAIVQQWREVHGLAGHKPEEQVVDGHPHRIWRDNAGKPLVEEYRITGMGHGTPLATGGECGCGEAGAFMLEAGISSTVRSAQAWGLLGERRKQPSKPASTSVPSLKQPNHPTNTVPASGGINISQIIERALRSAGLLH